MVTVMPDSGDFPHLAQPEAFAALMRDTGRIAIAASQAPSASCRIPHRGQCGSSPKGAE
jgi:hypothetical protein